MITDPYGVDPEILQYSTLSPRSAPAVGIGFGSPREFPFREGQPLDSTWNVQTGPDWTIQPHDGYVSFQTQRETSDKANITIARPFSLSLASVTIAFKLRVNDIQLKAGGFSFNFAPSLELNLTPGFGPFYAYSDPDSQLERLGQSNVKADGTWHRIMIVIQPGVVQIWEDDEHVVTWTPVQPLDATVPAFFGFATSGATASIDLSDVVVLVGSTQRARLRMAVSDQSDFQARINYMNGLTRYIPDVQTAAQPLLNILNDTHVRPGDLFWGIDVNPAAPALARALGQHASVSRLTSAAKTNGNIVTNRSPVLYIGINLSVSFVVSGTASCGFLIGSGPDGVTLWTFGVSAGGTTNAGIQGTGEIGVFWMPPRELLGFGASLQIDAGEVFQGSLGVTGNIPLHMRTFDNCGVAMTWGVGVSALPGDIQGTLNYTWNLAQI
jgi:hypothetical protein